MLHHSSDASDFLKGKFHTDIEVSTNTFEDSPIIFWEFQSNGATYYLLPDESIFEKPIPPKENDFLKEVIFPKLRKINE
jgi:hypothetical protein